MKRKPLITVGIPTYNRLYGLEKTLECIMNQSYENLDILISDNCSENIEISILVNRYTNKDKRIRYIKQDNNIGAAKNFKYLVDNAIGEYFMFAPDDDLWDLMFCEKIINKLLEDDKYVSGFCIAEKESILGKQDIIINMENKNRNERILSCRDTFLNGIHKTKYFQKAFIARPYPYPVHNDLASFAYVPLLAMITAGEYCFVNEKLYFKKVFHQHPKPYLIDSFFYYPFHIIMVGIVTLFYSLEAINNTSGTITMLKTFPIVLYFNVRRTYLGLLSGAKRTAKIVRDKYEN